LYGASQEKKIEEGKEEEEEEEGQEGEGDRQTHFSLTDKAASSKPLI
jgi:hypothetical protein